MYKFFLFLIESVVKDMNTKKLSIASHVFDVKAKVLCHVIVGYFRCTQWLNNIDHAKIDQK